jgi:DNA-binding transcriptional MerR regulator
MSYQVRDVLEIIGVSRKTLKSWLKKGVASPGRSPNGYRIFDDDDLRRLVEYKSQLIATTRYPVGGRDAHQR